MQFLAFDVRSQPDTTMEGVKNKRPTIVMFN